MSDKNENIIVSERQDGMCLKILTIPNILSIFRLSLIPLIVWLYCGENNYAMTGNVLIISGITDIADGFIARHFHMVSDLGKILDPIADKLTQIVVLGCLMYRFPLMLVLIIIMFIKETFMGITGFLIIRRKKMVHSSNWHGKLATVLLYITMFLHIFWYEISSVISLLTIVVCAMAILMSFVLYAILNLKRLYGGGKNEV